MFFTSLSGSIDFECIHIHIHIYIYDDDKFDI